MQQQIQVELGNAAQCKVEVGDGLHCANSSTAGQCKVETASSSSIAEQCKVEGSSIADLVLELERQQTLALSALSFGAPVTTIYHPIDYASEPHSDYVRRYCRSQKNVVFLGMNPGPFGMVQSGVPFGDCRLVREWLGVSGAVRKPANENAKRPIIGLECQRSEVSGTRFWNFIRSLSLNDDPNSFFRHCYVHNYCPAAFIDHKGKNITPASMKKSDLAALESICDEYLIKAIDVLGASVVVAIGVYARDRCRRVFSSELPRIRVEMIMHPSPANPATNTGGGWAVKVRQQLEQLDLIQYMAA